MCFFVRLLFSSQFVLFIFIRLALQTGFMLVLFFKALHLIYRGLVPQPQKSEADVVLEKKSKREKLGLHLPFA